MGNQVKPEPSPNPPESALPAPSSGGLREQFGITSLVNSMIRTYLIPHGTNNLWYALGGVLAISLVLEMITGAALVFVYTPDAATAHQSTSDLLDSGWWAPVLNFHFYNSYLIFGLVMIHMMRVFVSATYRGAKKGLWTVGVVLAAVVFALSITGETLHWDERGFAVPWHVGEFFEAIGMADFFNYNHTDLLDVSFATPKLIQIYAMHIVVLPAVLLLVMVLHYYLIRQKGISLPFWQKDTGRKDPFSTHIRAWALYGVPIIGAIVVLAFVWNRDAGPAPQNLPDSPYYGAEHGPGGLGVTSTFPISWTHGMNRFVTIAFNLEPDIWGTVIAMVIMTGALLLIPFVDRARTEPRSWSQAFDLRTRGWAFLLIVVFWATMITGIIVNQVTPVG
ncbi:MAG TPA: cytochrome b N-terminal domain-containing protein [Nocardioides sp.]|jgi:ubiquinol-cytochrome c reductase cytochrome b subunit